MEPKIIDEDLSLLVLDKPSGWVVTKTETVRENPTVEDWLKDRDYPLSRNTSLRRGIVHRLDKGTSGVLLVAKTADVLTKLQVMFKKRQIKKEYIALAHGKIFPQEGEIKAPVGRLPWNRKRFGILPQGKQSLTGYKVTDYFKNQEGVYTLVELFPKSGRTHQIRVHLKYFGHPIVSDDFYAGRKVSQKDLTWCPRLFLHARAISFIHPITGKRVRFESELPGQLEKVIAKLQNVS